MSEETEAQRAARILIEVNEAVRDEFIECLGSHPHWDNQVKDYVVKVAYRIWEEGRK